MAYVELYGNYNWPAKRNQAYPAVAILVKHNPACAILMVFFISLTITADPSIPVTFTRDNRVHIGPKMEMRVVTLGLDQSGKTAILMKLKNDEFMQVGYFCCIADAETDVLSSWLKIWAMLFQLP